MPTLTLKVAKCPSSSLALTNRVYVHSDDYRALKRSKTTYVKIKTLIYVLDHHAAMEKGTIGFSSIQRESLVISLNEILEVATYTLEENKSIYLSHIELQVGFLRSSRRGEYDCEKLLSIIKPNLDLQMLTMDQLFVLDAFGTNLKFKVNAVEIVDLKFFRAKDAGNNNSEGTIGIRGLFTKRTEISLVKDAKSNITLKGSSRKGKNNLFRPDWNFESMGIGGLDNEFSDIFRRAFASRVFPPDVVAKLGVKHVRGILLYGPPGTGKTLMARQIGKMLNGKEPKIVNGPEILNKYVGESEQNIRNLFIDAEREQQARGDDSDLHIIIFDEIDAICKQRGTVGGGTGVHDSVVNQLLAKIDGVDALNNVLLIGMTNRKDMIDEALLRPGRLEVHMEIGLPDEEGRAQIIRIHTAKMKKSGYMGTDVDLEELASLTKNYTGAEIEGIVKCATSFAFERKLDVTDLSKAVDTENLTITRADFMAALEEVRPKFGVTDDELQKCIKNGIIPYGAEFKKVVNSCQLFIQQVQHSARTPLISMLLEGRTGCGKTALAANVAIQGGFPFVKLISPETLVGYSESGKSAKIQRVFEDSYKSPMSVIVVDDIERLLDYVPIGPRFSNVVLQTLLVLFKKAPPPGKKLLIIATTSRKAILKEMGLIDVFHATMNVPCVQAGNEVRKVVASQKLFNAAELDEIAKAIVSPIPIKKLLVFLETAKQGNEGTVATRFIECVDDYIMKDLDI